MRGIGMKNRTVRSWREGREKAEDEGCRLAKTMPGHVCEGPLETAHIIDRSLGGGMEPDHVLGLCRKAHSAYDAHELDLLGHLTREEEVAAVQAIGLESARIRICPSDYTPFLASCRRETFAA